jgi:hypothetical protein
VDDYQIPPHLNPITKFKTHHGSIPGLKDRSDHIETLKIWCSQAFLDAHCYTILISPDEKECYLRKLLWRLFSQKPDRPFHTALEAKIPMEYFDNLMNELGAITMNPFKTSSDMILDAALIGVDFWRGDTKAELSWLGSFEGAYQGLERWMAEAEKGFNQFFPASSDG